MSNADTEWDRRIASYFQVSRIVNHAFGPTLAHERFLAAKPKPKKSRKRHRLVSHEK